MTRFGKLACVGGPVLFSMGMTVVGLRVAMDGKYLASGVTVGVILICTGMLCACMSAISLLLVRVIEGQKR